ncbi:hypothetical protein HPULCUR_002038 [Helicostylum pulchrum]|uniref:Uncharacterized protein n=1 Tax=Helicostylum pulchrum TaxID=562976 RepID=A0ABP9XPG9_9FUNG
MPRNRSLSASSNSSPALLSRGFVSLRRAHRRLSTSSPSSPILSAGENTHDNHTSESTPNTTPSATPAPVVITTTEENNTSTGPSADSEVSTVVRPRVRLVPNVGLSNRSFVFEIIDRELEPGVFYRIGRFSDRNVLSERLSFKSKVVSRNHAEIWTEHGKVFIRDIGSSSGTFLNRIRLSPPNHVSEPQQVKDGDSIQLGVDYQGGLEPIYRAVRIRIEINRQTQNVNSPFTRVAFQQLRSHLIGAPVPINNNTGSDLLTSPADLSLHRETTKVHERSADFVSPDSLKQVPLSEMMSRHNITDMSRADIQECCICLYAIAPFQALFIAPCSHIFHFKCLRPIVFQNYPGFSCPLCRSYYDLEASVSVEVDDVLEAIQIAKEKQQQQQQQQQQNPIETVPEEEENDTNPLETAESSVDRDHPEQNNHTNDQGSDRNIKIELDNADAINVPDQSTSNTPIEMNTNQTLRAHPRRTRNGESLLSATLVGSPIFQPDVLPSRNHTTS